MGEGKPHPLARLAPAPQHSDHIPVKVLPCREEPVKVVLPARASPVVARTPPVPDGLSDKLPATARRLYGDRV